MERLLAAIVNDDRSEVGRLLRQAPALAIARVAAARLFTSRILHWLYVGDTALHLAAAGHREAIVQRLLAAGAAPNADANHRQSTPLHYAADGDVSGPAWDPRLQVATLERLLAAGANVNAADKNGATALHRAVRTRCAAAVQVLLNAGADPLRRNRSGSTPLHLAVQNTGRGGSGSPVAKEAQRTIIRLLRDRGARPEVKDGRGKTVHQSAINDAIRALLA